MGMCRTLVCKGGEAGGILTELPDHVYSDMLFSFSLGGHWDMQFIPLLCGRAGLFIRFEAT